MTSAETVIWISVTVTHLAMFGLGYAAGMRAWRKEFEKMLDESRARIKRLAALERMASEDKNNE